MKMCIRDSVTMRESLNDVKQVAVTRDAILTFDSWKEDSKVHFTLNTNLHRPSICSIIKNHQIEVVEPINGIYAVSYTHLHQQP